MGCQMWSGRAVAGDCADKVSSEQKFPVLCYITFASVSYFQNISPAPSFDNIYIYIYIHRVAQEMYTLFTPQYLWNKFK